MKMLLKRPDPVGKPYTRGTLFINGVFECWTLEDEDRKLECGGSKVYGQTCIPRGTYDVQITDSNRFKRKMPIVVGVPGFSGIRIHSGTSVEHTEGCILVGLADDDESKLMMSRTTFDGVYARIKDALEKGEKVTLTIE